MKRYSEFINFPIYLWTSKEVDVEVPADEDESSDEEESSMHYSIELSNVLILQLSVDSRQYFYVLHLSFLNSYFALSIQSYMFCT